MMRLRTKLIASSLMLMLAGGLFAQQNQVPALQNVVQLSASAAVEVEQDLLAISLNTTRDGVDAHTVQTQLKIALDAALTEARHGALAGQMDVRTGNFSLSPRYGRDGKPVGWQGTVELVLEGRDFVRISSTAGKIQTLTLSQVSFSLSREQRARVEGEAQGQAIERFKSRASELARSFGMSGYTLREISVSTDDQGFAPRPRMLAMQSRAIQSDASVPVESGKTAVVVTVSGSVQLK
jgi:predicted secreted protein